MTNWPQSLVIELAARRCVIFLGSGASRSAIKRTANGDKNPPHWKGFLEILRDGANRGGADDIRVANELLDGEKYLDCAEVLRTTCIHDADYNRLLAQTFEGYRPTEIHSHIERIDQKIVVSTNYDSLYEDKCRQGDGADGYVVLNYYDDGLLARLRSPKRLIVKAHGSVARPEATVLTRSDYFSAREKYTGFYRILESLFLTHTLLFIGYSLSDPDIQLLLENASITAPSAHPHYALMAQGVHPAIRAAFSKTYNVQILEFDPANDYAEFGASLDALAGLVLEQREEQTNE